MTRLTLTATPSRIWRDDSGRTLARFERTDARGVQLDEHVVLPLTAPEQVAFVAMSLGQTVTLTIEKEAK